MTEIASKETAADAETAAAENADENVADDVDAVDLTAEDLGFDRRIKRITKPVQGVDFLRKFFFRHIAIER